MAQTQPGAPAAAAAGVPGLSGLSGASGSRMVSIAFVGVTIMLIIGVIAYIIYRFMNRDMTSFTLVSGARKLTEQGTPLTVDNSRMPVTMNGQEYGFSFWMYLSDYKITSVPKLLFVRGMQQDNTPLGGNPIVFLDQATNKLYVSISTNQLATYKQANNGALPTLPQIATRSRNLMGSYVTSVIEYVPLQRWVHIAFTVQDRMLSVFMDGDLYTVESVADEVDMSTGQRPIFSSTSGNVKVGSLGDATAPTSGYLGRLEFFNYGLTQRDVKNMYKKGPKGSAALGALGMSEYGVRSPVYRKE